MSGTGRTLTVGTVLSSTSPPHFEYLVELHITHMVVVVVVAAAGLWTEPCH